MARRIIKDRVLAVSQCHTSGGSAAGDLAGALQAQRTQVDGGPGAVRPSRLGIEGAVGCYVAMIRATQQLVILTSC